MPYNRRMTKNTTTAPPKTIQQLLDDTNPDTPLDRVQKELPLEAIFSTNQIIEINALPLEDRKAAIIEMINADNYDTDICSHIADIKKIAASEAGNNLTPEDVYISLTYTAPEAAKLEDNPELSALAGFMIPLDVHRTGEFFVSEEGMQTNRFNVAEAMQIDGFSEEEIAEKTGLQLKGNDTAFPDNLTEEEIEATTPTTASGKAYPEVDTEPQNHGESLSYIRRFVKALANALGFGSK